MTPFQLIPSFHERIWGGNKLAHVLKKASDSTKKIGESWEVCTVPNFESKLQQAVQDCSDLQQLVEAFPVELMGEKNAERFGTSFPLLIKFLDASDVLSVQVHPNDEVAKVKHNSFGKTEMWYVMDAEKDAEIIVGFNQPMSREVFEYQFEAGNLADILHTTKSKKGDCFYLPAGRIHAIGAGNLILEIQQTSDVTYRVYDWDRKDENGNGRELHIEDAKDAINYEFLESYNTPYNIHSKNVMLVESPYFSTKKMFLEGEVEVEMHNDSFQILICVEGSADLIYQDIIFKLKKGESVVVPAVCAGAKLKANEAEIVQTWV